MSEETKDEQPANVKKFFAICSKSTRKELSIMHNLLSTFLVQSEVPKPASFSPTAPATTEAQLKAKSA